MHSPGFISTVDTAVPLAAEEIQLILSFPRPQKPLWDAEEGKLSPYRWDREDRTQPGARLAFTQAGPNRAAETQLWQDGAAARQRFRASGQQKAKHQPLLPAGTAAQPEMLTRCSGAGSWAKIRATAWVLSTPGTKGEFEDGRAASKLPGSHPLDGYVHMSQSSVHILQPSALSQMCPTATAQKHCQRDLGAERSALEGVTGFVCSQEKQHHAVRASLHPTRCSLAALLLGSGPAFAHGAAPGSVPVAVSPVALRIKGEMHAAPASSTVERQLMKKAAYYLLQKLCRQLKQRRYCSSTPVWV
ncbi:hypothetical protein Anapl_08206 [Anas platyrhynchos]|uniref:Uncharacterized protein n=1 Tax=Anas platyrhynchos TaxID=8839 RepID=R0LID1_ANAPL|nr:hypothetical protein Anapl_08206 [Anas platyrhynchos]